LLIVGLFIELLCAITFHYLQDSYLFYRPENYLIKENRVKYAKKVFDADLGWHKFCGTSYGERPRSVDFKESLISTFGESFTYGAEVNDHETFQEALARLLQADVYNFGVGGYGTDQALLRFRRDFPKVKTPIAALGLITENINRIVNVYRPFYLPVTGVPLTKPRFFLRQGVLVLWRNPLQEVSEIQRLKDPNYVHSLADNDYWANAKVEPVLGFPYSAILLNRHFWQEFWYKQINQNVNDVNARPWENLWDNIEARNLMTSIVKAFVFEAAALGAKPVILLFPQRGELFAPLRGRDNRQIEQVKEICQTEKWNCFDGALALAGELRSDKEVDKLIGLHLTAKGNQCFAEKLHRWLIQEKIVAVH